jgi:uncharacterized protein (TIGR00369 family)
MRDLPMNVADTPDSALAKLIGRKILAFDTETGRVEVGFTITDAFLNMQGVLHGGAFATMLDTACGVAVRSRLDMEKFAGHATLELKTSYLKAGTPGDYLAKGQVQRMGKSIAFTDATLYNGDNELVASASATFSLRPRKAD